MHTLPETGPVLNIEQASQKLQGQMHSPMWQAACLHSRHISVVLEGPLAVAQHVHDYSRHGFRCCHS